jgi:uncharacterized membrane protein
MATENGTMPVREDFKCGLRLIGSSIAMRDLPVISRLLRIFLSQWKRAKNRLFGGSLYSYGAFGFWTALALVLASAIGAVLDVFGIHISQLSVLAQNPESNFFRSSLTLILSIISLVFVVVIFLVQNANQEYSSRLSGVILKDRYFLLIIGFILAASAFNISGSYFDWKAPLTAVGYAFALSTVVLVGSLIAFAGFFVNISNIINYVTRKIENSMSTERMYRPPLFGISLQDENAINQLTTETQLIVSTCIHRVG